MSEVMSVRIGKGSYFGSKGQSALCTVRWESVYSIEQGNTKLLDDESSLGGLTYDYAAHAHFRIS